VTDETPTPDDARPDQTDAQPSASEAAASVDSPPSSPTAAEAWNDVIAAVAALGDAVAAWARASADTPENRQHVADVRRSVNDMAQKADAAFTSAAHSDFGQQVRQGADEAGQTFADTAQKVSDAAAPHVASAFAGLADVFGYAAQKASEAAAPRAAAPKSDAAVVESDSAPADPASVAPAQPMPASSEDEPEE